MYDAEKRLARGSACGKRESLRRGVENEYLVDDLMANNRSRWPHMRHGNDARLLVLEDSLNEAVVPSSLLLRT